MPQLLLEGNLNKGLTGAGGGGWGVGGEGVVFPSLL